MKFKPLNLMTDLLLSRTSLTYELNQNRKKEYKLVIFNNAAILGKILNSFIYIFRKFLLLNVLKNALIEIHGQVLEGKTHFGGIINAFNIAIKSIGMDINSIPKQGPLIIYVNHPFSGVDVFVVASLIEKIRPDFKILVASYLEHFPGMDEKGFSIKVARKNKFKSVNKVVYQAINNHLKNGKALIIFPAGKVSRLSKYNRVHAMDPPWQAGLVSFSQNVPETNFVPVFLEGEPSKAYLKIRRKSWLLSNFMIIREFANQLNTTMTLHIGNTISLKCIDSYETEEQLKYLRAKLYGLGSEYFNRKKNPGSSYWKYYDIKNPLITKDESQIMYAIETNQNI